MLLAGHNDLPSVLGADALSLLGTAAFLNQCQSDSMAFSFVLLFLSCQRTFVFSFTQRTVFRSW